MCSKRSQSRLEWKKHLLIEWHFFVILLLEEASHIWWKRYSFRIFVIVDWLLILITIRLRHITARSNLNTHIKSVHVKEYLSCTICNKSFKTRIGVRRHHRMLHVEGEYKCPYENCGFMGKFRQDVSYHVNSLHQRINCEQCGLSLARSYYQRHLLVHKQIKNFPCSWPDCGALFGDSKTLKVYSEWFAITS